MTRSARCCLLSLLLRSPLFCFRLLSPAMLVFCRVFLIFSPLLPLHLIFSGLEAQEYIYAQFCGDSMNSRLFLRCGLDGFCSETHPCVSSWIRRPHQFKHMLSCVVQLCSQRSSLQSIAAGIEISNFLRAFSFLRLIFFIIRFKKRKIPRTLLALSSFGFSMAHFWCSLRLDASDTCFHISAHTVSDLEVVCFLVSLSPDHVNPSGGFSFNTMNLVKNVHASDEHLLPSTFQQSSIFLSDITSRDASVVLVTSMYFSGTGNDSSLGTHSFTLRLSINHFWLHHHTMMSLVVGLKKTRLILLQDYLVLLFGQADPGLG